MGCSICGSDGDLVAVRSGHLCAECIAAAADNLKLNEPTGKTRRPTFVTTSGLIMPNASSPWYGRLPSPGEYPFTRSVQPTGYRGRLWTMRQYAGFGTAEATNARFRYLLSNGQTGLSCAFDLPTQMGYDSDHPRVAGEVGRVGVAIDSLEDMEILLDQLPLDRVSTSMTINAPAAVLLALYLVVAERHGVSWDKVSGTVQNDILKEYIARGTYIFPVAQSLRLCGDVMEFCARYVPQWNPISISGYHMREAGCTAVQEIAFTLLNALTYVRILVDRGMDVDTFAPRLSFFFASHNHIVEEVAKFRTARRLWAMLLQERFGSRSPRSQMLRFHTQTAGSALTAQQPLNNVVRVALQALAAVLGGTQSLHTNSYDEALALPTEQSTLLALRTQQIIAYESGVADTVDPLGGAWLVERMTDELESRSRELIKRVEERGGMLASVQDGWVAQQIHHSAYLWQQQVERKAEIVVGVNDFVSGPEARVPSFVLDPKLEASQVRKVRKVRRTRPAAPARKALESLGKAAAGSDNLMPHIVDAVRAWATVGEICDAMRTVWGEYRAPQAF